MFSTYNRCYFFIAHSKTFKTILKCILCLRPFSGPKLNVWHVNPLHYDIHNTMVPPPELKRVLFLHLYVYNDTK